MERFRYSSVPGALAAVDVQCLAGHETRFLEEQDGIHDVRHFAHAIDGVQASQCSPTSLSLSERVVR